MISLSVVLESLRDVERQYLSEASKEPSKGESPGATNKQLAIGAGVIGGSFLARNGIINASKAVHIHDMNKLRNDLEAGEATAERLVAAQLS